MILGAIFDHLTIAILDTMRRSLLGSYRNIYILGEDDIMSRETSRDDDITRRDDDITSGDVITSGDDRMSIQVAKYGSF